MKHAPLFDEKQIRLLSVRQPWAHLIISGRKSVENRSWTTRYRGPIWIHAGSKMHDIPVPLIEAKFGLQIDVAALDMGAIIGCVELVDVVTQSSSPYFDGPYGWILSNPRSIKPVRLRGQMGFWDASESLVL